MAAVSISTPIKSHHGIFSTRTAGGRMPLTPPSNRTRQFSHNVSNTSSPFTPVRQTSEKYATNVGRISKQHKDSPKSNIAKGRKTPMRLELGVSDWNLTGTGPVSTSSPSKTKSRREAPLRSRSNKTTIRLDGDRFIPDRTASEGIITKGTIKIESNRPKTSTSEGSTILASAASTFDLGGHRADEDATAALEGLSLEDGEKSYTKPDREHEVYEAKLASACGISTNTRILAFKPAPPESSNSVAAF